MYRGENEWAKACSIAPQNASLAQLAEHVTVNHGVVGSSPSRGAKTRRPPKWVVFLFRLPSSARTTLVLLCKTRTVCGVRTLGLAELCRKRWFCQPIKGRQKGNGVRKDPVFLLLFFMCTDQRLVSNRKDSSGQIEGV